MKNSLSLLVALNLLGPLFGGPIKESLPLQELRLSFDELSFKLNHHQSEIDLLHERMRSLERSMNEMKGDFSSAKTERSSEKRIANLEKGQEALAADLKILKNHLTETTATLSSAEAKLSAIDQQLTSDIRSLKQSLHSMLTLLQKEDGSGSYTVKPGDSLGLIAQNFKTDVKTLKKLNNLTNDTIVVGQKLILP